MKHPKNVLLAAAAFVLAFAGFPERMKADAYTDVKEIYTGLMASPSVIAEAADEKSFDEMRKATVKPSSAVFLYGEGNARYLSGDVAGDIGSIKSALDKSGILFILKTDDKGDAEGLANEINRAKLTDLSVMSKSEDLLAFVSENTVGVRTIYDATEKDVPEPYEYLAAARRGGGNIVVLTEKQSDEDTTAYLQARFTTVWTVAGNESEYGFAAAVTTGAYGIVCKNFSLLTEVYGKYPLYSVPRTYYNVAHRGLSRAENENTIDAIAAAYECGATHVEIDVQMTKDGELAVMHDATINRTTNGSGKISEMTKSELSAFSVIKNIDGKVTGKQSAIPFLGDVLEYCKGKDLIAVIEIKDTNPLTCALIAAEIKKHKAEKQTLAISFYDGEDGQIAKMHDVFPELPVATLATVTADNFDGYVKKATAWNMSFDCSSQLNYAKFANSNLKDRGYGLWQWTYDDAFCAAIGISGITNNNADDFGNLIRTIPEPSLEIGREEDLGNAEFTIKAVTFGGETIEVKAVQFVWESSENGIDAVLTVKDENSPKELRRTVKAAISVKGEGDPAGTASEDRSSGSASPGGCRSSVGVVPPVFPALAAVLFIGNKKNNIKEAKI